MKVEEFARQIEAKKRQIDQLRKRKLPVLIGRMAKDHYQENFRRSGFVNGGLHQWPTTRRQRQGGKSAAANYGPLLSARKHLVSSIQYTPSDYRVVVFNNVPYAAIHNEGGTVNTHPTVTPRMRKFAWAKYYEATGQKRKKKGKTKSTVPINETEEARRWKALALTKKRKLNIHAKIPQRQFIGESEELNEKIVAKIESEITKIIR